MTDMPILEDMNKVHTGYADGPEIADTKAINSVDRTLSRIGEREICEIFNEGLREAADAAKQLGEAQSHPIWTDIGLLCHHIREQGMALFRAKGLSWAETLLILDARQAMTSSVLDAKRAPQKKFLMN